MNSGKRLYFFIFLMLNLSFLPLYGIDNQSEENKQYDEKTATLRADFLSSYFANSLLSSLKGVAIITFDHSDKRRIYFDLPNGDNNPYSDKSLNIMSVKLDLCLWQKEEVNHEFYLTDPVTQEFKATYNDVPITYPVNLIPGSYGISRGCFYPISVHQNKRPVKYFSLLVKGHISPESSTLPLIQNYIKSSQSRDLNGVIKDLGLDKQLNENNFFSQFSGISCFPINEDDFVKLNPKDALLSTYIGGSVKLAFIEDYNLLIHKLGNPVEKLPPDVADIRSKLQTDMGRAVLDKLVEYFAAKDKTPTTSNAPATPAVKP